MPLQQFLLGIFRPASPSTAEKSAGGYDVSDMGPYAGKGEEAGTEASGRLPEGCEPSLGPDRNSMSWPEFIALCIAAKYAFKRDEALL
jgi:hypothetical protein